MQYYSTLHLSSGFPIVIGLQYIEDYKKIKVAEPTDHMLFKRDDGNEMHGMGITHGYHHDTSSLHVSEKQLHLAPEPEESRWRA